jgi:hypothetical protein
MTVEPRRWVFDDGPALMEFVWDGRRTIEIYANAVKVDTIEVTGAGDRLTPNQARSAIEAYLDAVTDEFPGDAME